VHQRGGQGEFKLRISLRNRRSQNGTGQFRAQQAGADGQDGERGHRRLEAAQQIVTEADGGNAEGAAKLKDGVDRSVDFAERPVTILMRYDVAECIKFRADNKSDQGRCEWRINSTA
jgi:hypothetical protein